MATIKFVKENPFYSLVRQSSKSPARLAITDYLNGTERQLTFGKLQKRVDCLADYFCSIGVSVGDRIMVVSQNRYEIAEVFLASMKVGAIPLSINPGFSSENIKYVLEDSKPICAVIEDVTAKNIVPLLKNVHNCSILSLGSNGDYAQSYKDIFTRNFDNKATVYGGIPKGIVYTSGSTGFPKGVLIELRTVENEYPTKIAGITIFEDQNSYEMTPTISSWPMFHGGGLWAIWGSLCNGCPMVIMRYFDPAIYLELVSRFNIKMFGLLPIQLAMCLKESEAIERYDFSVQLIITSGGPCSPDAMERAELAFGCKVLSMYGMTEGGPKITMEDFDLETMPKGSCGRAEEDARLKLVGSSGEESNLGELWFKNETLFVEYYNRPDLMKSKFDNGWFKSGDVFYRDDNGFFFHQGRSDDMFVCDGENIYPQEIENILGTHEDVLQSCVVSLDDSEHGQIPLAMVFCRTGSKVDEEGLRRHYLRNGPMYAYPRVIKIVEEIPLLGPGKVNRPAIKEILSEVYVINYKPQGINAATVVSYNAKDVLRLVIGLWKDILKLEDLNKNDNIFELGVNSIQVTMFTEKAKDLFRVSFTIQDVFELATLSRMSGHLSNLINIKKLADNSSSLISEGDVI